LFGRSGGDSPTGNISWTSNWGDTGFGNSPNAVLASLGSVNGFASTSPYIEKTLGFLEATRSFTSQSNQSSVWTYALAVLGKSGGISISDSFGGIGLYGASGTSEKFLIGQRFGQSFWGATSNGTNLNGAASNSSTSIGNFTATSIAVKLNQQANTLDFYVNADFRKTRQQNPAAFTLNYGINNDDVDQIRLRGGNFANGNTWQFDNVNISQTNPYSVSSLTNLSHTGSPAASMTLNGSVTAAGYADITNASSGFISINNQTSPFVGSTYFVLLKLSLSGGTTVAQVKTLLENTDRAISIGYTTSTTINAGHVSQLPGGGSSQTFDLVLQYASAPAGSAGIVYYGWDFTDLSGASLDAIGVVVPEPASISIIGLGTLFFRRRR